MQISIEAIIGQSLHRLLKQKQSIRNYNWKQSSFTIRTCMISLLPHTFSNGLPSHWCCAANVCYRIPRVLRQWGFGQGLWSLPNFYGLSILQGVLVLWEMIHYISYFCIESFLGRLDVTLIFFNAKHSPSVITVVILWEYFYPATQTPITAPAVPPLALSIMAGSRHFTIKESTDGIGIHYKMKVRPNNV